MSICIIAVEYLEPSYRYTKKLIEETGLPVIWVDRKGVGSLAKAYNDGVKEFIKQGRTEKYMWMLSNIEFSAGVPEMLHELMEKTGYAAIHPCFESDHLFCRCTGESVVTEVPYIEFTAPMVRSDIMTHILLNEKMPYWGHDLDWGYRVRIHGGKIGVAKSVGIGHTYIRNAARGSKYTVIRKRNRDATNLKTRMELVKLYGSNWREVLDYK